jgi:hypothetical protein
LSVAENRFRLALRTPGLPSILLTVGAVALTLFALSASELRLDDFGLASGLDPMYYVGLALLPVASYLEWRRGGRAAAWLIVLHVVLFIVIVWVTPTVLEGTPRFRTSYTNYGYVDPLVRGDGLLPDRLIYHNWPLFPILMAGLVYAGIDPLTLLTWFPLVAMLLYLIPLVAIVWILWDAQASIEQEMAPTPPRQPDVHWPGEPQTVIQPATAEPPLSGPPYWAMALWVFPILDWTGQDYFSPQSFAFLLFLSWLVVITYVALRLDGRFGRATLLLTIGLYLIIVSTHVLTALLALGILFTLVLIRLIRSWTILVTCALIFLVWQVYIAAPFFEFYRTQLLQTILDLPSFLESNLANRVRGSDGHAFIAQLRIVVTAIAFGLGVIGAVILGRERWTRPLRLIVAYVLGVAIVAPVTVYGGEMLIRSLLFVLPMVAAIAAMSIRVRAFAAAFVLTMILMAPVHILTHFGNELYDYVSADEIAGFDFIEAAAPANVYGGAPAGQFENTANLDYRNSTVPKAGGPSGLAGYERPEDHAWANDEWPIYVLVSRGDDAAMRLFQNVNGFKADVEALAAADPQYVPVFSNDDMSVWLWTPEPAAAAP